MSLGRRPAKWIAWRHGERGFEARRVANNDNERSPRCRSLTRRAPSRCHVMRREFMLRLIAAHRPRDVAPQGELARQRARR